MNCELREILGGVSNCNQFRHDHHLISKQKTRNNPDARKLVDDVYPHLFLVEACQACHENAHNREVLAEVIKHRAITWTEDYVRGALDEIADTSTKGTLEDLRWGRLIG